MNSATDFAFVHGGGQAGWVWDETIAALARQTDSGFGRALALDAPGCGAKRGRPTEELVMEDVARELIADIEAAGLRDVILVGHSQAGQPLPIMARLRPDLFARLVYVSCSAPLPGQSVAEMIGTGMHGASRDEVGWPLEPATSEPAERYALMFCNDMEAGQRDAFLAKLGHDMWPPQTYLERQWSYDHLGDAAPATFVICLQDMALPLSWQEEYARRLRVGREVRIDAGHQVMISRPHALAEILLVEAGLAGTQPRTQ